MDVCLCGFHGFFYVWIYVAGSLCGHTWEVAWPDFFGTYLGWLSGSFYVRIWMGCCSCGLHWIVLGPDLSGGLSVRFSVGYYM